MSKGKPPTPAQVKAALTALRLYDGSFGYCPLPQQQRLYARFRRAMRPLETDFDAENQVATQARRLGPIRPQVGKDL